MLKYYYLLIKGNPYKTLLASIGCSLLEILILLLKQIIQYGFVNVKTMNQLS